MITVIIIIVILGIICAATLVIDVMFADIVIINTKTLQ